MRMKIKMTDRIGLYPGSFDPITNGHIDIIKRSLNIVDKLIIELQIIEIKYHYFLIQNVIR